MSNLPEGYARGPRGVPMRPIMQDDVPIRFVYPHCSVCDVTMYREEVVAAGWWYNTDITVALVNSYYCPPCAALVRE